MSSFYTVHGVVAHFLFMRQILPINASPLRVLTVTRLSFWPGESNASSSSDHTLVLARKLQTASSSLEALPFRLLILLFPPPTLPRQASLSDDRPPGLHFA